MPEAPEFNELEQEAIVLKAVWDLIGDMVNYEIFEKGHALHDAQLIFKTGPTQRLFNVLLSDFLSKPQKGIFNLPEPAGQERSSHTFLFYLKRITKNPQLNETGDVLNTPVQNFIDWLEEDCLVKDVWFPSIPAETDIRIKRLMFLKICGDIAKHSFPRLGRNVERIQKVLADNGVQIDMGQGIQVLPEFYDWFHINILNYHGSVIAEHLNNIRWGIYEYLRPEFMQSFLPNDDGIGYRFSIPQNFKHSLAKAMYWDLMNAVRSQPYFPQFEVTEYLRMRY